MLEEQHDLKDKLSEVVAKLVLIQIGINDDNDTLLIEALQPLSADTHVDDDVTVRKVEENAMYFITQLITNSEGTEALQAKIAGELQDIMVYL